MPKLSTLNIPSLSKAVLDFFAENGITTVEDFLVHDIYNLVALGEVKLKSDHFKQAVTDIFYFLETNHTMWFDGVDLLNLMEETYILPSGCRSLDEILGGGLRSGAVSEIVGASSSGKTQVCIQIAARAVLHGGQVAYIDTGNSFSSSRFCEVLSGLINSETFQCKEDIENYLKLLLCFRVHDVFSLLEILHKIDADNTSPIKGNEKFHDWKNVRLIVLDSISSLISPVLSNVNAQGHALMINCGQILRKIASTNNCCVLITNHTVEGLNRTPKAALGESWKVIPHVRMLLSRQASSTVCSVSLLKHGSMASNKEAVFRLGNAGLETY